MKHRIVVLLLLGAVLVLTGCTTDTVVSPELIDEPVIPDALTPDALTEEERVILSELGLAIGKRAFTVSRAPVYTFENPGVSAVGASLLVRQDNRILLALRSELEPGTAVTLWLVIFNAPWNCTDNECGADDFTNPDARVDIVYADGRVILPRSQRRALRDHYYFATRYAGDSSGSIFPPLFGAEALGLEDANKAEIHLVLRDHGPVIAELEDEMTSTFNAGCEGLPPEVGTPGPNTCEDIQFAVHRAVSAADMNDRFAGETTGANGFARVSLNQDGRIEVDRVEVQGLLPDHDYELKVTIDLVDVFTSAPVITDNQGHFQIDDFDLGGFAPGTYRVDLLVTHTHPTGPGIGDVGAFLTGLLDRDPLLACQPFFTVEVR